MRETGTPSPNLYINDSQLDYAGLFGVVVAGGEIKNVGLTAPNSDSQVAGDYTAGGLVASLEGSKVVGSYSEVGVSASYYAGGLAGSALEDAVIQESYATGDVSSEYPSGGLVGLLHGSRVAATYATGDVSAMAIAGGLVGLHITSGIVASYATGDVTTTADVQPETGTGALVGSYLSMSGLIPTRANYATGAVTAADGSSMGGLMGYCEEQSAINSDGNYYDTQTTGLSSSSCGVGRVSSSLKSFSTYVDIYSKWNVDIDGDGTADDPWDFGTSSQYPVLKYGFLNPAQQRPVVVVPSSSE